MKTKSLPKVLFVRREVDGDISYLVAEQTYRAHADMEESVIVGEYRLVLTRKVEVEVVSTPP